MAEVTELVTKFSFKGNTSPLNSYSNLLNESVKNLGSYSKSSNVATKESKKLDNQSEKTSKSINKTTKSTEKGKKSFKGYVGGVKKSIEGLAGLATGAAGAIAGLNLIAKQTFNAIDPIAQLNRQTGIAVESIQELGYAASVNGGSVEGMYRNLEKLSMRIGEAVALGSGEGVRFFEKLGITLTDASGKAKTADVVFDELRQSINRLDLDKTQVQSLARKLGLNPSSVQLLMKTNEEMDGLRNRARDLGIVTKEQADATADYNDSLTTLNTAFNGIKRQIAVGFLPRMQKSAEAITDFLVENKELIKTISTRVVKGILAFSKALVNVSKNVFNVIKDFAEMKGAIYILIPAVVALMAAFTPLTLIVAGIGTLILIVDDLISGFKGGDSVIFDFMKKLNIPEPIKKTWELFKKIIDGIVESIKFVVKNNPFGKKESSKFGSIDDAPLSMTREEYLKRNKSKTSLTDTNMILNSILGKSKPMMSSPINQNINIDIKTNDPMRAGRAVQESLQKHLNDAQAQTGLGGF